MKTLHNDRNDLNIDPPHIFSKPVVYPTEVETKVKRAKTPKRRLYPVGEVTPPFIQSPIKQEAKETIPKLTPPSHYQVLSRCLTTHDALVKIGKEIFEDRIQQKQIHLMETAEKYYEKEREANALKKKNKTLDTVTNILGIVGGVVAMCVAGVVAAAGGAITAVGLFLAGAASVTGAIFELSGISNKFTTGLQIVGGIVGLISGGAGALTGALKIPFAIQIGTSLLTAAKYTTQGISSIYQKRSLEGQAEASILDAQLDIDRMDIEEGAKIITHAAECYEANTMNLVAALKNEIDIYKKLVSIQQSGRN